MPELSRVGRGVWVSPRRHGLDRRLQNKLRSICRRAVSPFVPGTWFTKKERHNGKSKGFRLFGIVEWICGGAGARPATPLFWRRGYSGPPGAGEGKVLCKEPGTRGGHPQRLQRRERRAGENS